jgi:DNA-binding response OmpR family regulator
MLRECQAASKELDMPKDRVLIIDDDTPWIEAISSYLDVKGFETYSAFNCGQAEISWRSTRPDVALLDHNLPDGTALTFARVEEDRSHYSRHHPYGIRFD